MVKALIMRKWTVAALLLLMACAQPQGGAAPSGLPVPPPEEDTCGARDYASVVGQDATSLERVLILRQVRVIRPGQPVTADFRPERINFLIGPNEVIERISCG